MGDVDEQAPAALSRAWIGRAAFEAGLIVLGLVGALLVDEWRTARERTARVQSALASIRSELEANRTLVALGHAYTALSDYMDERRLFTNYLYTNPTDDFRRNPQGITGWLNDMSGHAKRVERRLDAALQTLPPP